MQTEPLLQKLAEFRPTEPGRSTLMHLDAASGWTVAIDMEAADALSVRVKELTVSRKEPEQPVSASNIREAAERICNRVTGLMEKLRLLEIDSDRRQAILRSDSPTVRKDRRSHFELVLTGTHRANLRRYEAAGDISSKREQVPFSLTKEVFGMVLEHLIAALQ